MSGEDFRIVVCDMPHREELIAEVYYKNEQWSEISAEIPHNFVIQFFNCDRCNYWEFPFDEAMEVLQDAKNQLAKYQRTPEQQKAYDEKKKEWAKWEEKWEEDQRKE